MKNKKIIIRAVIIVSLIAAISLVCFGFTSRTIHYSGTLTEDGIESNVMLTVKYRRIDSLFHNMHGTVTIETENSEPLFDFTLFGRRDVVPYRGICYTPISIYNETQNWLEVASLYFDKEWKNIAVIYYGDSSVDQPRRDFYSGDDDFVAFLSELTNSSDPS